jgi:hypothetical protein
LKENPATGEWYPPVIVAKRFLEKQNFTNFYPDSVETKIVFGDCWVNFKLKQPQDNWTKVYIAVSKDGCASFIDVN